MIAQKLCFLKLTVLICMQVPYNENIISSAYYSNNHFFLSILSNIFNSKELNSFTSHPGFFI